MPLATPARIAFITQATRNVAPATDTVVAGKYGDLARDTADVPVDSLFDDPADALIFATERLALLNRDARRITTQVTGVETGLRLDPSQIIPVGTLLDPARQINRPFVVGQVGPVDTGKNTTELGNWG